MKVPKKLTPKEEKALMKMTGAEADAGAHFTKREKKMFKEEMRWRRKSNWIS